MNENLEFGSGNESEHTDIIEAFPIRGAFCTGIENSDPVVGNTRRNQLKEAANFEERYKQRLDSIHSLGIRYVRFGVPYSQVNPSRGFYDFTFSDKVHEYCKLLSINIIADFLHFGLPDYMHEGKNGRYFQNDDFPRVFVEYVREYVLRYPEITIFTLVNEPYVASFFSAKIGIWNEQIATAWDDDSAYVRAARNIARAVILAKREIEKIWIEENRGGSPIFLQTESFERAISRNSSRDLEVQRFNIRRFAILDLIIGNRDEEMKLYLLSQGMSHAEHEWFMLNGNKKRMVIGIDHYITCIHVFHKTHIDDCSPSYSEGLRDIIKEYYQRYNMPMLHTEINAAQDISQEICKMTFDVISDLRNEGYPILGFSWYGDEYQVGWQSVLTGPRAFDRHEVGLFSDGKITGAGELFQELAEKGFEPIKHSEMEQAIENEQ